MFFVEASIKTIIAFQVFAFSLLPSEISNRLHVTIHIECAFVMLGNLRMFSEYWNLLMSDKIKLN